ncbi:hypothetical protein MHPYR_40088 [uncultured Mycobacterium sp.]|uniref:Uncharacterized protein n=1 Tax=uncultured Mycobacterium sp. TaxID=171292 RepID=A0A1Y5PEF9_9MYCO|nr:hypothetical protein MHPYR_40088 [uncultured Mycobacterium sp.]
MTTVESRAVRGNRASLRALFIASLINPLYGGPDPLDPAGPGRYLWAALLGLNADDEGGWGDHLGPNDAPLPHNWGPHGPIIRDSLAALALVGIASHLGDSVQQRAVLSQAAEILSTQSRQLQETVSSH